MPHGAAAIESGAIEGCTGEMTVETEFGEQSLHGRTLNAMALFESEVSGNEAVHNAREPDVPVGSMGF